jgi:ABC-2 type transport system permease protein
VRNGMIRDALYLARKDVARLLLVRETLVWTFLMPIVFFYFIGTITGNVTPSADGKDFLAVHVPADSDLLTDQLLARLDAGGYQIMRLKPEDQNPRYIRRLDIPAGFSDAILAGNPPKVRFTRADEGLGNDYDRTRISRVIRALVADVGILRNDGVPLTSEAFAGLARERNALALDVTTAGKRIDPPRGYDQSVPGSMVMFTMLVLFTVGAVSLTMERNTGILRRLASAPLSRGAIVLGKWGARMAIGMIQIAFAMIAGTVLFLVHWGPNLPFVALVLLAYAALETALGMLLGNFGRTTGMVVGIGVITSNVLVGLGGCWWPIEITPFWVQKLAIFPSDRLDDGRVAQTDQLRKFSECGHSPHLCDRCSSVGGRLHRVTVIQVSVKNDSHE